MPKGKGTYGQRKEGHLKKLLKEERKLVYDPLRKSHGAFDKAVKDAKGDVQKLKDAVKKHPSIQAKKKRKIPSVNA